MADTPVVSLDAGSAPGFTLGYRPPLDGIRGVALLSIMLFHNWILNVRPMSFPVPGAFFAVDMFFGLSGFLITAILAQEFLRKDRIDLRAFYARRALRLFPALVVFLVGMLVYAQIDLASSAAHDLRGQVLWTGLYAQNWNLAFHISAHPPFPFLLDHAWTLSVEEQFYFLWPLLLWGVLALRRSRRMTVGVIASAGVLSAIAMAVIAAHSSNTDAHALYGTEARAQALLFGSALGLAAAFGMFPRPERRWPAWVGGLGALYFVTAFVVVDQQDAFPTRGGYMLAGLATTAIIFGVVHAPKTPLARVLGSWVPLTVGKVSYGGYLWHLPVFYVLNPDRTGLSFWPLLVLRFAVTFVLAAASFHFVERPALRFKRRFERRVEQEDPGAPVVLAPGVTA